MAFTLNRITRILLVPGTILSLAEEAEVGLRFVQTVLVERPFAGVVERWLFERAVRRTMTAMELLRLGQRVALSLDPPPLLH